MKFKLAEIQEINKGLPSITRHPLPVRLSYRLAKLIEFFTNELKIMETARRDLVKKYSDENPPEQDTPIRVKPENEKKFTEEMVELLEQEVELDFEPIDIKEGSRTCPKTASSM